MTGWEMRMASLYEAKDLSRRGWEPYAVSTFSDGVVWHWLRRPIAPKGQPGG